MSLRKTRVAQLLDERRRGARAVRALRAKPERFIATVQVGITLIGASAAAFGGRDVSSDLAETFRAWGLGTASDELAFVVVIVLVSYLSLVIGELVPKSLALRYAERYALFAARPLLFLGFLARPLTWFLTASSNVILRAFGDRTTFSESRLSPDELQQLVEEAAESGAIDPRVGDIASRAFDFSDLRAGAVMTPKGRIVAVPRRAPTDEVLRMVAEHGHSRMPVYEDSMDRIVGYVVAKDVVTLSVESKLLVLEDIIRPAYFVPEGTRVVDLLREMQRRRIQMAIVLDEHGAVSGLITIEDLIEELVGDILAEHETPDDAIRLDADGSALVKGSAPIREVNRALDVELPENSDFATVAGLCIHLAGWIPQPGARYTAGDGSEIEILAATPRAVEKVRIRPRRRAAEE